MMNANASDNPKRWPELIGLLVACFSVAGIGGLSTASSVTSWYAELQTQSRVTPYVGVGVGTAMVDFADFGVPGLDALDDDDDVLGYQAIAGLAVKINDRVHFRSDVRYLSAEDADVTSSAATGDTSGEAPYSAIDLTLGLRFTF